MAANRAAQSTDAENSRSLPKVSGAGGDKVKGASLGKFSGLAVDQSDLKPPAADQTFQKVPAGI